MSPLEIQLIERLFTVDKKAGLYNRHPSKITDWNEALEVVREKLQKTKRSYKRNTWYALSVFLFFIICFAGGVYYEMPVHNMIMPAFLTLSNLDSFYEKKVLLIHLEEELSLVSMLHDIKKEEDVNNISAFEKEHSS